MFNRIYPHIGQFILYLISGTSAALIAYGSYLLLLHFNIYYVAASVYSDGVGFVATFTFHKYGVFRKSGKLAKHFGRYCLLALFNVLVAALIIYACVEYGDIPKEFAKLISMASVVLWNFFLYKFVVYV
ncbi:MAG: GtrA family protein [bacterium]|nr:GtrA family protein [bacterium]